MRRSEKVRRSEKLRRSENQCGLGAQVRGSKAEKIEMALSVNEDRKNENVKSVERGWNDMKVGWKGKEKMRK